MSNPCSTNFWWSNIRKEQTLTCETLFEDVIDNWWCKRWLRKPLWLRRQETSVTDGVIWRCGCTRSGAPRLLPSRAQFFEPLLLRMWGLKFCTLLYFDSHFRTWMLLWWGSRTYVLKSCLILITSEYSSAAEMCQKLKWGQVTEGDLGLWPQFVTRLWFRYIDPTQVFSVLCNPDKIGGLLGFTWACIMSSLSESVSIVVGHTIPITTPEIFPKLFACNISQRLVIADRQGSVTRWLLFLLRLQPEFDRLCTGAPRLCVHIQLKPCDQELPHLAVSIWWHLNHLCCRVFVNNFPFDLPLPFFWATCIW